ncbi:MAG: nucleotidyltransferase family protein [Dehalococcoidia bacterium]|nr:nucleotidyltransferase family protein [Dehalococcoidia bacterium]
MYALIIAGGEGERLRPLTSDRPKPMIEVAGTPILEHQVRWLAREGVSDAILLCGYKAEAIQRHFGDGSRFGLRTHYSLEEVPLGRGGALKLGARLLPPDEDTVIALNGDILTDQPLAPMLRYHRRKQAAATVMLTRLRSPYGVTRIDRTGRITAFDEKPLLREWINAGLYVVSREFLRRLPDRGDHETTTFPQLVAEGRLFGYRSDAYWRTVDTFKDLTEAAAEVAQLAPA